MTRYTEKERKLMSDQLKGMQVEELQYDHDGDYYTLTFTGPVEFSFKFMSDLVQVDKQSNE